MSSTIPDGHGDNQSDNSSVSEVDDMQDLNAEDEEGWEDAEPDVETIKVVDLFGDDEYPDANSMIEHCKAKHGFDLRDVIKRLGGIELMAQLHEIKGLDFYSCIKLVNYIRAEVKNGNLTPDVSSAHKFQDDRYLLPVLQDDSLLFSLDELIESHQEGAPAETRDDHLTSGPVVSSSKEENTEFMEEKFKLLQMQFEAYKETAQKALGSRWDETSETLLDNPLVIPAVSEPVNVDRDEDYYNCYAYNDIHEVMLKDKVRTDAYRDFIYANKHLFKDKVVLDVGCGTAVLSMFCAKAGASKVFAVDNSSIVNKAREIVYANGLDDKIACIHGKIEEVKLPEDRVDVIVSEWMGYCLLYEAMLDSVIWARDRYLKKQGGFMVPSHCTIHLAPVSEPEYIVDSVDFWSDVYGFDMKAMTGEIYDNVMIQTVKPENLAAKSARCFTISLNSVSVEELDFSSNFELELLKDINSLDGWVVWFDTFFLTPGLKLPVDAEGGDLKQSREGNSFTTGPYGARTHWQSGLMLIKRPNQPAVKLQKGTQLTGRIGYVKGKTDPRSLDIEIHWQEVTGSEKGSQIWHLQ